MCESAGALSAGEMGGWGWESSAMTPDCWGAAADPRGGGG
jgi:hypothetical protein